MDNPDGQVCAAFTSDDVQFFDIMEVGAKGQIEIVCGHNHFFF